MWEVSWMELQLEHILHRCCKVDQPELQQNWLAYWYPVYHLRFCAPQFTNLDQDPFRAGVDATQDSYPVSFGRILQQRDWISLRPCTGSQLPSERWLSESGLLHLQTSWCFFSVQGTLECAFDRFLRVLKASSWPQEVAFLWWDSRGSPGAVPHLLVTAEIPTG